MPTRSRTHPARHPVGVYFFAESQTTITEQEAILSVLTRISIFTASIDQISFTPRKPRRTGEGGWSRKQATCVTRTPETSGCAYQPRRCGGRPDARVVELPLIIAFAGSG
jgi:hypothetical protein